MQKNGVLNVQRCNIPIYCIIIEAHSNEQEKNKIFENTQIILKIIFQMVFIKFLYNLIFNFQKFA
jgi:hypothetical protein